MAIIAAARLSSGVSETVFYVLHPLHVLLSALVTTAMYHRYRRNLILAVIIGYVGSVAIGTLSDIILPHLGGWLIGLEMGHLHQHIGFIEKWWLVNPLAFLGIAIGIWRTKTRVPHFGHVLLSTWASLFYLATHAHVDNWYPKMPFVFLLLFLAVWFPCCLSDILFPLLFVGHGTGEEDLSLPGHEADGA